MGVKESGRKEAGFTIETAHEQMNAYQALNRNRHFSLREDSFKSWWNKPCIRASSADHDVCDWIARHIMKMLWVRSEPIGGRLPCSWRLPEPRDNEAQDKTTVKRDCRNLQQTVGRLVLSEPGSYTHCTGWRLSQARGGREESEGGHLCERMKEKYPYVTEKHSAQKHAIFPHVARCFYRDRQQQRGMSVCQTVSGMRRSASRSDELTSPNILYLVGIRGEA